MCLVYAFEFYCARSFFYCDGRERADDEDFSLEGLILSDKQRKVIDKLDMNTQLTVIKALREQQGIEKPKPKKENSEKSELDVLREKVDEVNREVKVANNEYSGTKKDYWLKYKINTLPIEISDIVFDNAVVEGQSTAIKNLQKALNIKADGIIGPKTINALRGVNYKKLKKIFSDKANAVEDEYQRNDLTQKVFEKGHRKRYNSYSK